MIYKSNSISLSHSPLDTLVSLSLKPTNTLRNNIIRINTKQCDC